MAEKYQLPKITLNEEAKRILINYKWPGNVRQLKNITEQMSILSREREITAENLTHFIPQDQESMQLAIIQNGSKHSYEKERDILYKILYELRENVSTLRRDINNIHKKLEENSHIGQSSGVPISSEGNNQVITTSPTMIQAFEDAEEVSEPESLNLNDIGKQMVEKALERNNGNRKKAAHELGISDRTLYRRIKQYGLETNK